MKVILKVSDIPVGSVVTKPTGSVPYVLQDKLVIYKSVGNGSAKEEINAMLGTRFIVPQDIGREGIGINAIPTSQEMAWIVDEIELYDYLQGRLFPIEDK